MWVYFNGPSTVFDRWMGWMLPHFHEESFVPGHTKVKLVHGVIFGAFAALLLRGQSRTWRFHVSMGNRWIAELTALQFPYSFAFLFRTTNKIATLSFVIFILSIGLFCVWATHCLLLLNWSDIVLVLPQSDKERYPFLDTFIFLPFGPAHTKELSFLWWAKGPLGGFPFTAEFHTKKASLLRSIGNRSFPWSTRKSGENICGTDFWLCDVAPIPFFFVYTGRNT